MPRGLRRILFPRRCSVSLDQVGQTVQDPHARLQMAKNRGNIPTDLVELAERQRMSQVTLFDDAGGFIYL
jgi:hypothetical protein